MMRMLWAGVLVGALGVLPLGCRDDTAAREAEEAKRRLAAEQEARYAADEAREAAEEARRAAERRCEDMKKEKDRSSHIARVEKKQAEGKISTLSLLAISSVLGLTVVILLLARERSLRRVVNAALIWLLGREESHDT